MPPRIRDSADQIAQSVRALQDSADVIESFRPFENLEDNEKNAVARNWKHLEIMLAKPQIVNALDATSEGQAKKATYTALIAEVKALAPYGP